MVTVIKRDKSETSSDLAIAIDRLIPLLENQDEKDACADLREANAQLKKSKIGSPEHKAALAKVIDAFEGDHELNAYTHQRANSTDWTEAEELALASSRVLNLARRITK